MPVPIVVAVPIAVAIPVVAAVIAAIAVTAAVPLVDLLLPLLVTQVGAHAADDGHGGVVLEQAVGAQADRAVGGVAIEVLIAFLVLAPAVRRRRLRAEPKEEPGPQDGGQGR